MNILIVPDSFKGCLTSAEVCKHIKRGIEYADNSHQITALPFSDGGEGFTECMQAICKGDTLYVDVQNIYGKHIQAPYLGIGDTAVLDTAAASGLLKKKAVMAASSTGTGELIKAAVTRDFKNIILGLGGTGCCDGGAGALTVLGADFYDENYYKITRPCGGDLNDIFGAGFRNIVKGINFTFATDVENEFYGKNGAAYVFAPQKGANPQQTALLDEGLKRLNAFLPNDVSRVKGSGAAGGICGGLFSVYGGTIKSGFEVLAEYAHLEEMIETADLIITGEGKTDAQTLMGKLPYRIATMAKKYGKRCAVISGVNEGIELGDVNLSLTDGATSAEYAILHAGELLEKKAKFLLQ